MYKYINSYLNLYKIKFINIIHLLTHNFEILILIVIHILILPLDPSTVKILAGTLELQQINLAGTLELQQINLAGILELQQINLVGTLDLQQINFAGTLELQQINLVGTLDPQQINFAGTLELQQIHFAGTLDLQQIHFADTSKVRILMVDRFKLQSLHQEVLCNYHRSLHCFITSH
jgi:hypothetical protein